MIATPLRTPSLGRRRLLGFFAFALSGCASLPDEPETAKSASATTAPVAAREALRALSRFALAGRFSARHEGRHLSGGFAYRTDGLNTIAEVFSPLGNVLARLQIDAQGTTLALADGSVQTSATVASLIERFTGLTARDEALPLWLRGLPATRPVAPGEERFIEHGWSIELLATDQDEPSLPRRMRWQPLASPDSEILWLIDRWVFD
ncbi:MAG: outer membrane lipoprotein LolB [Casimicrobiaceae bacterium]|nr:outer membrane lipoprotein LolB [Casimicrobiaceae bacterium]MDW8312051.1 outer membrane lipoprotein LolB [Burkholderiales bacterium]